MQLQRSGCSALDFERGFGQTFAQASMTALTFR